MNILLLWSNIDLKAKISHFFENQSKITEQIERKLSLEQLFLLLTDENGKIILSHELIVGDTKEFERVNLKVHALFNIL